MTKLFDPARYWERRYRDGRTSGAGSEGETAKAKAEFVNAFIKEHDLFSVIDLGCGDGTVLSHMATDINYFGFDVSPTIIDKVRREHPRRNFAAMNEVDVRGLVPAELSMSMDVLFHFPDDVDYYEYLDTLFESSRAWVLIYATDYDGGLTARHVRRRKFTVDVKKRFPDWELVRSPEVESLEADFYIYQKENSRG